MLQRIQEHTIKIYDLSNQSYQIETIKARTLLSPYRFDLYAKLYYIKHRDENKEKALEVYYQHIKAFNPDWKEPGREDKINRKDFIETFDKLIDYFQKHDFDNSISIVPIGKDNTILDGAHRIAALAYWDKEVTIARFDKIVPKCQFDYEYFKQRGLSNEVSDLIANEICQWNENVFIACLWPKMGNAIQKGKAKKTINTFSVPFYIKEVKPTLNALTMFIANIYRRQNWVGNINNGYVGAKDKALNCYAFGQNIEFVYFCSENLNEVLKLKESIRTLFPHDKHSIHITDTHEESIEIAFLTLTNEGLKEWLYQDFICGFFLKKYEALKELIYYFKKVIWLNLKIKIVSILHK